ncbi:MAG TPA: hypothetical protein VF395_13355 [Polyangiaceae bacterium]
MGIRVRLAVHVVGCALGGSAIASCELVSGVNDLTPARDVDASLGAGKSGTGGAQPDSGPAGAGGASAAGSGGGSGASTAGGGEAGIGGNAGAVGAGTGHAEVDSRLS